MKIKFSSIIFFLCVFSCMVFAQEVYAGRGFEELVRVLQNPKITQIKLKEVEAKHAGKNIEGRAYIVNIGEDTSGIKIVNMCTHKELDDPTAVMIVVYLRRGLEGNLSRFKSGDYRYFFGPFKEIRMRTIVIEGGFVK